MHLVHLQIQLVEQNETDNFSFETGTTNNTGTEPRGGQNVGSIPNNWVFHSGSNSG